MKSVLLLLPGAFSGYGGIEMYNRQFVRAFLELGQERGFEVRTLILNDETKDVDDRYAREGEDRQIGFGGRKVAFAAAALRGTYLGRPDLIVLGHVHFARLGRVLGRLSPASRLWYLAYGIDVWRALSPAIQRGLAIAESILAISRYTAGELQKNADVPPERIGLLPCALDPAWQARYGPGALDARPTTEAPPLLLTVARLAAAEGYKGVDSVLRSLPGVLRALPDLRYEVVGDGDDRPRLESLAGELGVRDHVRFRGRLGPDELASAYRACTLYVMPSSHEGFGIVFLEAALFGKPSIGGRHGGTPEVIEDGVTGLLVDREDVAALERALVRLLKDEKGRAQMGAAARARLEERFTYVGFRSALSAHLEARHA
ncbi:MAG: glycosyltransferase family 4 protein [Thermoanaerobaculia bacterium]